MLNRDPIEKAKSELPKDIEWIWERKGWDNDRVEAGPFTTKKEDTQKDIVVMGERRLHYIFKYGHLIYEHHSDPSLPVEVLADCLAVGFDKSGQTFGIWGWYDGSETIDDRWGESQQWGKNAGYSIGGKKTDVECTNGICTLLEPEVLEVSKTKTPANRECSVYYINQLAKSTLEKSKEATDTFEIRTAERNINKKLKPLFELEEGKTEIEAEDMMKRYPCTKDYVMGLQEVSEGFIKSSNARIMLEDKLESLKKSVIVMTDEEQEKSVEKMDYGSPGPETTPAPGGNATLDVLNQIVSGLAELKAVITQMGTQTPPPAEGSGVMETPEEPPMEQAEEPPAEEPGNDKTEEPEEKDDENKEKYRKSKDGDLELPEGENPEPESPNPEVEEGVSDTEEISLPDGENPEPEGKNPEVEETVDDKGDVDDNAPVHDTPDGVGLTTDITAVEPEDLSKQVVKPKVEKEPTWQELAKANGAVVFRVDTRPETVTEDQRSENIMKGQVVEKKKGVFDILEERKGNLEFSS